MDELAGRCAVVTGAGSGIGAALALGFAAERMRVAVADIEIAAAEATAAAITAAGGEAVAVAVDVADADAVAELAATVDGAFGGADLLCNNAGVFAGGTVWERPVADFEWVMSVNFYGILHGIRAFLPGMIERGRPGHVVNTVSAAGLFPSAFSAPYTAAKFAALGLTECLASELAASGVPIGVTALCPGAIRTAIGSSARNRPAVTRTAATDSSEFVERMLVENTERGMEPELVVPIVLDAIRSGRFLQLTSDSYGGSLRTRTDELLAGGVPRLPDFV